MPLPRAVKITQADYSDLRSELDAAAVLLFKVIESMEKDDPAMLFLQITPLIHAFLDAYEIAVKAGVRGPIT